MKIAITGNIGSGKSEAIKFLSSNRISMHFFRSDYQIVISKRSNREIIF
jgi:dephospho-CoA kinase